MVTSVPPVVNQEEEEEEEAAAIAPPAPPAAAVGAAAVVGPDAMMQYIQGIAAIVGANTGALQQLTASVAANTGTLQQLTATVQSMAGLINSLVHNAAYQMVGDFGPINAYRHPDVNISFVLEGRLIIQKFTTTPSNSSDAHPRQQHRLLLRDAAGTCELMYMLIHQPGFGMAQEFPVEDGTTYSVIKFWGFNNGRGLELTVLKTSLTVGTQIFRALNEATDD